MGFSRQEYWSGLPFPSPGYLPDPEVKPQSPALEEDSALQAESLPSEPPEPTRALPQKAFILPGSTRICLSYSFPGMLGP